MVDISALPNHIGEIAYGVGVCFIVVSLFYAIGATVYRGLFKDKAAEASDLIVAGAAIFVMCCWYGVKTGNSLDIVVSCASGFWVLCFLLYAGVTRSTSLGLASEWRNVLVSSCAFIVFFSFMYLSFYSWYDHDKLPIWYFANNDVFNYINTTDVLQKAAMSTRIAGYSFLRQYEPIPGVIHIFELFAKFYRGSALDAAIPILVGTLSTVGVIVATYLKKIFLLDWFLAVTIATVFLSGGFLFFVSANFFLSQLLGSTVALLSVYATLNWLKLREEGDVWWKVVRRFLPYSALLLYLYPILLSVTLVAQVTVIAGYYFLEQRQTQGHGSVFDLFFFLFKRCIWWGVALSATVAVAAAFDLNHFFQTVQWVFVLSKVGLFGWPLDLVSPAAVLAIPDGAIFSTRVEYKAVFLIGWAFCIALGLFFFISSGKSELEKKRASLCCVFSMLAALYVAYYLHTGVSYVQWKFASYAPLLFAFAVWGEWLCRVRRYAEGFNFPGSKRVLKVGVLLGLAGIVGANVFWRAPELSRPFDRYSAKYRDLESIDHLLVGPDLYVSMSSVQSTFLSVFFLRKATLHLVSLSYYYPQEQIDYSKVSRAWPLFVEGASCGDDEGVAISSIGCLYFAAPGLLAGAVYKFSESRPEIAGLGAPEAWGVWNKDVRVALTLRGNALQLAKLPRGYINFDVQPLIYPGSRPQRLKIQIGERVYRGAVDSRGWISVPYKSEDWSGQVSSELKASFEFPDAVAPKDIDSSTNDSRKLAIGFISLSLTAEPVGVVVAE